MNFPWDEATERACGLDVLRRAIAPGCGFGRAVHARERSFGPGDEEVAAAAAAQVCAVAQAAGRGRLERFRTVLAAAPDPATLLLRAGSGEILEDPDFFDLVRFCEALRALRDVAGSGTRNGSHDDTALAVESADAGLAVPAVDAELEAALAPGRTDGNGFYLADAFDPALSAARAEAAQRQAAFDVARSRLEKRAAAALGWEQVRDGEFIVMRDAAPQPLPPEIRVLREAPSYLLCELSLDDATLASLAARDAALAHVAATEEAVRARLSQTVAAAAPSLEAACERLGRLDLLAAKAAFAARYGGTVPHFVTTDASATRCAAVENSADLKIALVDVLHPPLFDALATRGARYVPLTLELDGLGVVTGPNMGGKTAALRTLGFAFACAALGVPVPGRSARFPLAAEIAWLGIGAGESDANRDSGLLSSFGAEVIALQALLERPARPLLVLVDEFARTTSPREGRALLVALLETLRESGAFGLAATHLDGVAAAAGVAHFTSGRPRAASAAVPAASPGSARAPLTLDVALRELASEMDYTLRAGPEDAARGSGALELAAALGLDAAFLERAAAALPATDPANAVRGQE